MTGTLRDRTTGVLTTQKLQALLDSGLNADLRCRRSLATAMTDAGEKISVHGVEGWFKHVDSNYAIERESLHPELRSYPVPRRRWGVILDLFTLAPQQLDADDDTFRRGCFERRRHAQVSDTPGSSAPLVFVLYAQLDGESVYDELQWLRGQGLNIWWETSLSEGSEWSNSVATVIERAERCLVYLSGALADSDRCHRQLQLANEYGIDTVVVNLDDALPTDDLLPYLPVANVLQRADTDTYRKALLTQLGQQAPTTDTLDNLSPQVGNDPRPSVAVLPFANLSGQSQFDFIARGITEDLNTLLARVPELMVSSRLAAQAFVGMLPDYHQLRDTLGVAYAVEGSVRLVADHLRVNVSLTELASGRQLWAQRFDGLFDDLYAAQDEMTAAICEQLQLHVAVPNLNYGDRTSNVDTWRLCHLGWYKSFVEPHMPSLQEALDCFYGALEQEPNYAPAHAGIANALGTGMIWGGVPPEEFGSALQHAQRAYELLPDNPAVLYAMGMVEFITPSPMHNTLNWVEQAVELEPSNAAYLAAKAYLLAHTGDADAGLELCGKVARLAAGDLRQPFINYMVSNVHICAGNFRQGIDTMLLSDGLQSIDFVWFMTGFCWHRLNEPQQAEQALQRMLQSAHRSLSFFTYSIEHRLWPQHSLDQKRDYLAFCQAQGLT